MQTAKELKEYKKRLNVALHNDFLRQAMENFALAYPGARARAFEGLDAEGLIADVAAAKDAAGAELMTLYRQFKEKAEAAGAHVHLAKDPAEANELIKAVAGENRVRKIVKSKSMTAEEIALNHSLEAAGLEVTETDLGEWIVQLRGEGPSHMVLPAIHLSRYQVADLFGRVTGQEQAVDIERLVKVARRELRRRFVEADMGITGANFAVAETGTLGLVTNEGNARLATTLPRVHVALVGLEKLTENMTDALRIIKVLTRNATGQAVTSYLTWITGATPCAASDSGEKELHIVFLDNGRLDLAKDPIFAEVLRCVRCGACANVCPVYRLVGGHEYGHVYIGAIGLILTYFYHGRDKAKNLVQNCINCQACQAICAGGIDLPRLIKEVYNRIQNEEGGTIESALLARVLKDRKLFHRLLKSARLFQKPAADSHGYLRHPPHIFFKDQNFRALPALADKAFRDKWPGIRPNPPARVKAKVALFSGCVQDFVYPNHLEAALRVLNKGGAEVDFPLGQSCCGLPVWMMGEKAAARQTAQQNVTAVDPARYDYIVCCCASCASHLKHAYPRLLKDTPVSGQAQAFADKVVDFSSLAHDVLGMTADDFTGRGPQVTYHAPCHLCRGMGVDLAPRALIQDSGCTYAPSEEEDVCCGFGGTYSTKFPQISAELLKKKLDRAEASGAEVLVTDCPGCVMQIKGGAVKRSDSVNVRHIAEILAERL